ncbi:hypothetical protein BZA70DRAFT_264666 [Myxozyma melibiosi]|uniref:Uncharacterized protein n=1 Tax=Myxozyma melibiosi TaxID=54550 RepID=A0ABR1FBR5_9ASCO
MAMLYLLLLLLLSVQSIAQLQPRSRFTGYLSRRLPRYLPAYHSRSLMPDLPERDLESDRPPELLPGRGTKRYLPPAAGHASSDGWASLAGFVFLRYVSTSIRGDCFLGRRRRSSQNTDGKLLIASDSK